MATNTNKTGNLSNHLLSSTQNVLYRSVPVHKLLQGFSEMILHHYIKQHTAFFIKKSLIMESMSPDLGSMHSDMTELSRELEEPKEGSIQISQTSFKKGDRIKA